MRYSSPSVMTDDEELLIAQRAHHLNHVLRHRSFRITRMIGVTLRFRAIAIATQVRSNHRELFLPQNVAQPCATSHASQDSHAAATKGSPALLW